MKKLQKKIMAAGFGRLLKRWGIAALCVVVLGGGISAALLSPQIRETVTAAQTIQRQEEQTNPGFYDHGKEHEEREDIFPAGISHPSTAAVIALGATALLCGLLALAYWLLVAAWLDQAAVRSGMNGPLWGVLGLLGNVLAAILFLIVRSFLRGKCPACGHWQDKKTGYCVACGSAMRRKCPNCGTHCSMDALFCPSCGLRLEGSGLERKGTC